LSDEIKYFWLHVVSSWCTDYLNVCPSYAIEIWITKIIVYSLTQFL